MSMTLIRSLALGVALTLGAVACGTDAESAGTDDGVATLQDGADSSTDDAADGTTGDETADGTAEAPADTERAYALYNECMADYGFDFQVQSEGDDGLTVDDTTADLDDPQEGTSDLGDVDDGDFDAANKDCEKHLANIDDDFDLNPEQQAMMEDAQLKWAECMREQGVDVPDMSDSSGGATITVESDESGTDPQSGGADDSNLDKFNEASEQCNHHFDALNDSIGSGEEG